MSTQTVTCPHCRSLLRADKPVPVGVTLRCPGCKLTFSSEEQEIAHSTPPPLPSSSPLQRPSPSPLQTALTGAPFLIAVSVSVLLGCAIIASAVILSGSRPPAEDRAAEERAREEERNQLAQEREKLAQEGKKLDYRRVMARAETALSKSQYSDAEKLFQEALDLMPGDKDAMRGLVEAKAALAATKKVGESEEQTRAEVARLLDEARKASADKQYATAVQKLTSARLLAPSNRSVLDALEEAQKALDSATDEKAKLAEFKQHMEAGKAALTAERFADAVKEYTAALGLMPDDLEAKQGQKQAENKLLALADKDKRQKAFDDLLDQARKAQGAKRFKDAARAAEAALRIVPEDRDAMRMLRTAKDALKRAKAENAKLLAQADALVKSGRLADAKEACDKAVDNWAEDSDAEKMQKTVGRMLDNAKTSQTAFQSAVQSGVLAMAAARYADAVNYYTRALQLMPNDFDTLAALRRARAALAAQVKGQVTYNQAIKNGAAYLATRSWSKAVSAFQTALTLAPGDPVATEGLSQARYGQAMVAGQQALAMRQRGNAINAFQAALTEKPGDRAATQGLRQAQLLR
jgi:tetratricopeptide (TPR) repeat protein